MGTQARNAILAADKAFGLNSAGSANSEAHSTRTAGRPKIIQLIGTPLSFYVLALLIVETTLGLVLVGAGFGENLKFAGFLLMIAVFLSVLGFVGWLTVKHPTNLLYGKEEHSQPQLTPSALRDQIEDIVVKLVRPESLKS